MNLVEKRERVRYWNETIVQRVGTRYAKPLDAWQYYGSDSNQASQRIAIEGIEGYCCEMYDHLTSGKSLILFGTMGTGKDYLITHAMRYAVLELGIRLIWVNGAELLDEFHSAEKRNSKQRLIQGLSSASILVISDILQPGAALSDFETSTLLNLIDKRYRARRPTWLTLVSTDREDAEQRTCPQLIDRLWENAEVLDCKWPSYRERLSRKN